MKTWLRLALFLVLLTPRTFADPLPRLILLTQSKGFAHDVVKHPDGGESVVQKTFKTIAEQSKLFNLETTEDASTLTAEKLKSASIVAFYTTGDLPLDVKAFDDWIQNGGGFLAVHTGTDTLHGNPTYLKIINGEFDGHPWTSKETVTVKVDDPANPTVAMFDPHYTLQEEIYQYKNFDPSAVRVLLSLDMERTALKRPEFVPIVWCKEYGKGKVFHTELGHNKSVWESDVYQKHLTAAIGWLLGKVQANATPNPEVARDEEELAKKVAATQPAAQAAPATPVKAKAAAPRVPKVVKGFTMTCFVQGPEIQSPAGIAVSPDGKVFVGEDAYNSGPDRKPGLSRINLCVDTDGDGKADKITTFADNINSPQGMCFAGGTLYVTHAPYFTALRDTKGNGVADFREDLITGLGPPPEGLVQHVPSGVHMGIDGWLYISIGDKGIKEATGKDGRKITLHGGGIIRIRPDGTELQIFCTGTRNIFDVAIDPFLNTFTRDNTNDGDGWWSRLTQMQRDAAYGYPNLYEHFNDEIIQPMADYGSGGATGAIYIHEPNLPGNFGDCLYTTDWARGIIYRHMLTPDGAGFKPTQENFVTDIYSTHTDVDGSSRIYVSDWGRRDWSTSQGVGAVYVIRANPGATTEPTSAPDSPGQKSGVADAKDSASAGSNPEPQTNPGPPSGAPGSAIEPFPDLHAMTVAELVDQLAHRSAVRRREAQLELIHRGNSPEVDNLLKSAITDKQRPLYARVAELFTLVQLMGAPSHTVIAEWVDDPDLREFVLRALVDRDTQLHGVNPRIFADALSDPNPRVRVQAAIGLGRLHDPSFNAELVPLTADDDQLVRFAAQQSLRLLGGSDACIAAISATAKPKVIAGAMRVMRSEHDHKTVIGLENLLENDNRTIVHHEAIKTLARLYEVEATWDGSWWMTRPDTRGPNYKSVRWDETPVVAQMMISLANDPDEQTAKDAIDAIGLCGVSEAVPMLTKLVSADTPLRENAANALIAMKSSDALVALEHIAVTESFDPELRNRAAGALGAVEGGDAQSALIRMATHLDAATTPSPTVLQTIVDALGSRSARAEDVTELVALFNHGQLRDTRIAAAEALLRSAEQPVKDQSAKLWDTTDDEQLEALLTAAARVPADQIAPFKPKIEELVKSHKDNVRHAALIALGHLGDAGTVKTLLAQSKGADYFAAASALAEIPPEKAGDDEILPAAKLLTDASSSLSHSPDRETYTKILAAAEKFAADERLSEADAQKLLQSLKRNGVIYAYMATDSITAPSGPESFSFSAPPEKTPAGPFETFTMGDTTYTWKPLTTTDPQGIVKLTMPAASVMYLTTSIDAPTSCTGVLTCGSDDGIQVWVNGKKVITKDMSRPVKPDEDRARIQLLPGKNTLLFKVNNQVGPSGIQARVRWRPSDFEPAQLAEYIAGMPTNAERGKEIFSSLGCVKCHTIDRHDEPKGPFLGDVGAKFDDKYIIESILRPSAKIAQGFSTVHIISTNASGNGTVESIGFLNKESADEVQLRDLTGKVTTIVKSRIKERGTLPGSMMPEGLADALSLEDFRSLLAYLQSLKGGK